MKTYRVAVFTPTGRLEFYDYKEFNTREEANDHLTNLQRKFNSHMAVISK